MPFVKINRVNQFADKIRNYQIFVDDQNVGEISSGSSVDFYVTEGSHRILMKIDWCSSNEINFNAQTEETIEFDCGNNTKSILALYYVLFAPKEYLWLKRR